MRDSERLPFRGITVPLFGNMHTSEQSVTDKVKERDDNLPNVGPNNGGNKPRHSLVINQIK